MRSFTKLLTVVLCLSLLAGCGGKAPTESTAASSSLPTEPNLTQEQIIDLYRSAADPILWAKDLTVTFSYEEARTVGGEVYTETASGTASYMGLNTASMYALVEEKLTFGTYEADYQEFYTDGCAYTAVMGHTFATDMKGTEFVDAQLPAVLLDPKLYSSVSAELVDGNTVITFSGATALEAWATQSNQAQLTAATGTATLDASGNLLRTAYQAQYTCGTAEYSLNATAAATAASAPDLSGQLPTVPESCASVSHLDIPRSILQAVGDIYTAQAISASSTETLYSDAFAATRTQNSSVDTFGTVSGFMARITDAVSVTDYSDITTTNTQTMTFRDGVLTYTVNDGDPNRQPGVTVEQMREDCEDMILSSLFALEHISDAAMEVSEDLLYITFTGNDLIAQDICTGIYNLFQSNLDNYATSYTTPVNSGYLSIDKHTGLPTSMGIYLIRTHVFDNVYYDLTYQLDRNLLLSSPSAYENITGNAPMEDTPQTEDNP